MAGQVGLLLKPQMAAGGCSRGGCAGHTVTYILTADQRQSHPQYVQLFTLSTCMILFTFVQIICITLLAVLLFGMYMSYF